MILIDRQSANNLSLLIKLSIIVVAEVVLLFTHPSISSISYQFQQKNRTAFNHQDISSSIYQLPQQRRIVCNPFLLLCG